MADRTQSNIKKVGGVDPNFLADYIEKDDSLELLKEHRTVPRIKLMQSTTAQELKSVFGEGSAVLRPGDALVCKYKVDPNSFQFVPVFFFVEFAKWIDLRDANQGKPSVEIRSFDPTSDVAKCCRDVNRRYEVYPGHDKLPEKERHFFRYVEHLRFVGTLYGDHPLALTPATLSFERGEFQQGKNFISAITLRRQIIGERSVPVPLWAQVWEISPMFHDPAPDRKWFGFKFEAADPPIITPNQAQFFQGLHKEFKELFEAQRLTVDDEPIEDPASEGDTPASSEF